MAKVVLLEAAKRLSSEFGYTAPQLREAIPYIREFQNKVIVIKAGGSVLDEGTRQRTFFEDIVFMAHVGMRIVVVHGGSRRLNRALRDRGIESKMERGHRVTDLATLELAVRVFNKLNGELVEAVRALGGKAVGFRGGQDGVVWAERDGDDPQNFVGKVTHIDTERLLALKDSCIPVLTCIGAGEDGTLFNINADEVAGALARELRAEKLILLTDVDGVRDARGKLISTLTARRAGQLIRSGVIRSGMIPKVEVCLGALQAGVGKAHIINGFREGSLLCEVLSDRGVGTEIVTGRVSRSRQAS